MNQSYGELDGWPGTYWIEKVGDRKIDPPDLSQREYYKNKVEEAKEELRKINLEKPKENSEKKIKEKFYQKLEPYLRKLHKAKQDLFVNINEPVGLYRAYLWKQNH